MSTDEAPSLGQRVVRVPAHLVAAGIGLPEDGATAVGMSGPCAGKVGVFIAAPERPAWGRLLYRTVDAGVMTAFRPLTEFAFVLTAAPTLFDLAVRTDRWEAQSPKGIREARRWCRIAVDYNDFLDDIQGRVRANVLSMRIAHIGMDHALRRRMGETPAPGTLAAVRRGDNCVWSFDSRRHGGVLIEWAAAPASNAGALLGSAGVRGWRASVPALAEADSPRTALQALERASRDYGDPS